MLGFIKLQTDLLTYRANTRGPGGPKNPSTLLLIIPPHFKKKSRNLSVYFIFLKNYKNNSLDKYAHIHFWLVVVSRTILMLIRLVSAGNNLESGALGRTPPSVFVLQLEPIYFLCLFI